MEVGLAIRLTQSWQYLVDDGRRRRRLLGYLCVCVCVVRCKAVSVTAVRSKYAPMQSMTARYPLIGDAQKH